MPIEGFTANHARDVRENFNACLHFSMKIFFDKQALILYHSTWLLVSP